MIIQKWQAPVIPNINQIKKMFLLEGLQAFLEDLPENTKIKDRIFPFDEVRIIVSGELILEIVRNRVLLREGDRVMIPSNTAHSISTHKGPSQSLYARKVFSS